MTKLPISVGRSAPTSISAVTFDGSVGRIQRSIALAIVIGCDRLFNLMLHIDVHCRIRFCWRTKYDSFLPHGIRVHILLVFLQESLGLGEASFPVGSNRFVL